MQPKTRDWMDLITEMIWIIERETKFTLRGIHDDFKASGLSFDGEFRKHFMHLIMTRVGKTYDQYTMKLEFEELENRCETNAMDSDGSFVEWQQSTEYYERDYTPKRPNVPQKRKKPDELDVSNQTFVVKRPRFDERLEMDVAIENDSGAEENKTDETSNRQSNCTPAKNQNYTVEVIDKANESDSSKENETPAEVESTKEVEAQNDECLVSTNTDSVAVDTVIPNVPDKELTKATTGESTKRRSIRIILRRVTAKEQSNDAGIQQTKGQIVQPPNLSKPAPASVKARLQALNAAKNSKISAKAITDPNIDISPTLTPSVSKTNGRPSNTSTPSVTIVVDGKKLYKCEECEYTNTRRCRMSKHMLKHKETPFHCQFCPKCFSEQDLLDIHLKVHENQCSKCKKKFNDNKKLEKHQNIC